METQFYDVVRDVLGPDSLKGKEVLHVGCYRFEESQELAARGAAVTGLDPCRRIEPPAGIRFVETSFLTWKPDRKYDLIYASNSALFMPTAAVMDKIAEVAPKTIAVRTMFDYPEPNWPKEKLQKLYFSHAKEWQDRFEALGYKTAVAKDYETDTPDLHGDVRKFRFAEYVGTKA